MAADNMIFAGAAHVDWLGQFDEPATQGLSVPGRWKRHGGGAAFNAASLAVAAGLPVTLHSVCGDDEGAAWLATLCKERGLRERLQSKPHARTASYTAMVNPDGQLVQALANMEIYRAFDPTMVASSVADWLVVDANLPSKAISNLMGLPASKKVGLTVSAAKAPRLLPVLAQLDLLFTNASELGSLLKAANGVSVPDLGVKNVVVSNGSDGVEIWDGGVKTTVSPRELNTDEIVSVVGAGDGLAAGTLVALWQGASLQEAVQTGVLVAQEVLRLPGPWADTMPEFFSRHGFSP